LVLIEATIMVSYTLSSYIEREHLFVWSVFAPKLIYLLAGLGVKFVVLAIFCFVKKNVNETNGKNILLE
jgi:hypothetical protein